MGGWGWGGGGGVNDEKYLAVLNTAVIPLMEEHQDMYFQQDGVSAHYANIVRNRLN